MKRVSPINILVFTLLTLGLNLFAFGQVSITQSGVTQTETFNNIGSSAGATLPGGWRINNVPAQPNVTNYGQSGNTTTQAAGTTAPGALTSSSSGGAYNFVNGTAASSTDRAIGFLASGSFAAPRNIFVQIQNNTGQTINTLNVAFAYEKYRNGGRGTTMRFYAGTDGVNWTPVAAGDQVFAADAGTDTAVNNPPTSVSKTVPLTGASIPNGAFFYLRWEYTETAGSGGRQAVGIDDVSLTADGNGGGTNNPNVTISTTQLANFGAVTVGTTSAEKSYTVSGSNLSSNLVITPPAEFLVSLNEGGPYVPSLTLTPNAGSVPTTTVYVVFAPTSSGAKSGTIANASTGATTQNVSVSGTAAQSFAVTGQVSYKSARPVAGITVNAFQNGSVAASAVTDPAGGYSLNLAAGGTYTISVASAPFSFSPAEQTVANLSGNQAVNFNATGASVLISEFRFRGTNEFDEFVELYNNSDLPVDISGFAIASSETPAPKFVVPGNVGSRTTVIPARGHYLVVGPSYTLSAYAAGDGNLTADIPDAAGIGLFTNPSVIGGNTVIDAVGFAPAGVPFIEGTPLNPAGGITSVNADISFIRNFGGVGYPADSDNNAADFSFVSTNAGNFNGAQSILGAPGPENLQSPIFSPNGVTTAIFDTGASSTAPPNRLTDTNATNGGLTPRGTVSLRRTYTNNTPFQITRFRLRVVGISTIGSAQLYTPQSVVRALSSIDVNVTKTNGQTVLVKGLTLEAPPTQPQAGGLNSSLIVNLSAPINPNESINVDTVIGIVESGRLIFNTAVEATVAAPVSASEHLVMGNPSNAVANVSQPNNYLLDKPQYAVSYNRDRGIPNWVSWHLDSTWRGPGQRQDDFREDPTLPAGFYRVQGTSYQGSGFDRGHNTPSADRTRSNADNSATFLMTNMIPQAPDNNQGPWNNMEQDLRTIMEAGNELYIIMTNGGTGGTGSNGGVTNSIDSGRVAVPAFVYKVAIILPVGDNDVARVNANTRVIAVKMPNTQGIRNNDWRSYRVSVDQIESETGLDFFSNVPANIQAIIEARVDNQ